MKSRALMVQIHLILAGLFLPFLLIMPLTGSLYILDVGMGQVKETAFVVEGTVPAEKGEMESFFRNQFSQQNIDFDFEYIKTTATDFIFRPTSRVYYVATQVDGKLTMQKITPDVTRRLMELHKGHGPSFMRNYEMVFGFALLAVAISGVWIAFVTRGYRRNMLISMLVGFAAVLLALI